MEVFGVLGCFWNWMETLAFDNVSSGMRKILFGSFFFDFWLMLNSIPSVFGNGRVKNIRCFSTCGIFLKGWNVLKKWGKTEKQRQEIWNFSGWNTKDWQGLRWQWRPSGQAFDASNKWLRGKQDHIDRTTNHSICVTFSFCFVCIWTSRWTWTEKKKRKDWLLFFWIGFVYFFYLYFWELKISHFLFPISDNIIKKNNKIIFQYNQKQYKYNRKNKKKKKQGKNKVSKKKNYHQSNYIRN